MAELITEPGYLTEFTERGAKGRWVDGDNVRFEASLPQKIGGCQQLSNDPFIGICRAMINFKSLALNRYIALATNLRFYVYNGGEFFNVTPLRVGSSTLTNPFSSTATTSVINVADTAHGVMEGDYVTFTGATASPTDGTLINGDYVVASVVDADNYTITLGSPVTTTEAGFGGTVTYYYEISPGMADALLGDGFGTGPYGMETWGTPRTSSGINIPLRNVSLASWGEDVIWNIRSGGIYVFDTSAGIIPSNRATLITQAPDTAEYIIVSPESRHLIALGAHNGANDDPMLVAWSSQEDYTIWTASELNTAGDYRLDVGTRIVTAVYSRGEIVILTDEALYSMVYDGYPVVFRFSHKASECGAISPMSAIEYNGIVYWMGETDFFVYDGVAQVIPCEVHGHVFDNINRMQVDKIYCGLVTQYGEIWWLYPSAGSTEIDSWVVYNIPGNFFFFGSFNDWQYPRTAWLDRGEYSDKPISAATNGQLWEQETGYDHGEHALPSYLKRSYEEIGDGEKFSGSNEIIPDFRSIVGEVQLTLLGKRYPQDAQEFSKQSTITSTTAKKNMRIRARQISVELRTSALGAYFSYGTLRVGTSARGNK